MKTRLALLAAAVTSLVTLRGIILKLSTAAKDNTTKILGDNVMAAIEIPPGKDLTTCHGYWGLEGSFCDKGSVVSLSENDAKSFNEIKLWFSELIDIVVGLELGYPAHFGSIFNGKYQGNEHNHGNTNSNNDQYCRNVTSQLLRNHDTCMAHLRLLRNNSICTICTLSNAKHILDGHPVVGDDACLAFERECMPHVTDLKLLWGVLNKRRLERARYSNYPRLEAYREIRRRYGLPNNLEISLDVFFDGVALENGGNRSLNMKPREFCSRMLTIRRFPSLGIAIHKLLSEAKVMQSLSRVGFPNGRTNWRHLQLELSDIDEMIFTPDIVMLDAHSVNTISKNGYQLTPMNLSLAFP